MSNPDNQNNSDTSEKLIKYLIKNKHWSPLEMVNACLEIETTRDIARQILRHRSFSFQEFSQRYADPTKELEFVTRESRLQDEKNRQDSIEVDDKFFQIEWERRRREFLMGGSRENISGRLKMVLQKNKFVQYYQRDLLCPVCI